MEDGLGIESETSHQIITSEWMMIMMITRRIITIIKVRRLNLVMR